MRFLWIVLAVQLLMPEFSKAIEAKFESLGVPVRIGGLMGCIAGPDGHGGEALYFNMNETGGALFLVQVNPDTGEAHQFNAPQGAGAWAFILGPDEKIYLGTWESGWLLQFDPRHPEKGIVNLGKPAASESYLWQFAIGKDGKIYACTFPNAKLVSYDPKTGKCEDLGRMHPTEMYARSIAAGRDGWLYIGIGTRSGDMVAYNPETKEHHSVVPAEMAHGAPSGTGQVLTGEDGKVYGIAHGKNVLLEGGKSLAVASVGKPGPVTLRDGRVLTDDDRGRFTLRDPKTGKSVTRAFKYQAAGDAIFVVGNGPGNCVYGSTVLPIEIFRTDFRTTNTEHLGGMHAGEVYSMLEYERKLYMCYYPGSIMTLYDPAKPEWNFGTATNCNPISFGGIGDGHLRPRAMIYGPERMIYIGSEAPYGQLGGAMAVWDPRENKTVENYRHIVTNQSIVSLAWDPKSGLVFGGSGNWGGGGTHPVEKEAKFFAFDPKKKQKVFEKALVPGTASYPAMAAAEGKVFVVSGVKMLVFDPGTMSVVKTIGLPGAQVEISLGDDGRGRLVGLTRNSLYMVDPEKEELIFQAKAPVPVSCGFAMTTNGVYFGSGPALWRCKLK